MDLRYWLPRAVDVIERWGERFGPYTPHRSHQIDDDEFALAFERLSKRLDDNYPFFHPSYAGQMVKPPHPAAVVGYVTTMLFNPNNHAAEGGPATTEMEREVITALGDMFGLTEPLGHLTTSGTMANLEALYVARESHPGRGVAFSSECHYTHERMCQVLAMEGHRVPVDGLGRIELDALEGLLRTGRVGTVVVTTGTTGLGAVDPVHEVLALARRYGARVHVDAAYGGFYALLGRSDRTEGIDAAPWRAISACDSVVVDPHKHGLQPYGCGAVLFNDPHARRHFAHDSPYTYFTQSELHLGEISLECSRSGAAAAALWLTLQLLPLTRDGFGAQLAASRRAAVRWADLLVESEVLELYQRPELDIVTYVPAARPWSLSAVDAASGRLLHDSMHAPQDPVFLSVLRADADAFVRRHPGVVRDADTARVMRSVLIKPEAELHLDQLHARVEQFASRSADEQDERPVGTVSQKGIPVSLSQVPATSGAVRPASPADAEELVALLAAAFFDDPLTRWITPDDRRRAEVLPGFFRVFLDLSLEHDGVLTTPDRSAVLLFLPPGAWEQVEARGDELERRFREVLGDEAQALATITALQAQRHPVDRPHYYASFGAVRADVRKSGLMSELIGEMVARADVAGCGTYAEASSPGGAASCLRFGFEYAGDDIVLPDDGPRLRPLWREPQ
ncbi:pyridoxal phosphate-dependent decarboxylase family protein [Streptomyces sp. NBC_01304]|uniref:pyridoxal phosphate-dependent decarboxylase family protein n=1 Tax=Streptomyces sp. NBC_01304 TaxID=2903818 RepID=UPI003FA3BFA7